MSGNRLEPVADWPLRAWALAVLGALVGLAIYTLTRGAKDWQPTEEPLRLSCAVFLAVGGLALAYTVERGRIASSAAFAVVAGAIMAAIVYWHGGGQNFGNNEPWRLVCGALTIAIGAPLFTAWRDRRADGTVTRNAISYVAAHNRAWTNVVLWFASWTFVGIAWALAALLGALFNLIGIHILQVLLGKAWFALMLTGGALGAAIGLLRDREAVLGTLRRVVTTVLSVLAPVLAAGLILFLVALPVTGLSPLWSATKATTPILISCVIGALILANAVIGDADDDASRLRILRWSAMGLGAAMLPLGVIAAISTGLRIAQYGLTPDRIWAVVFAAIACAYGAAYLAALARGRMAWAGRVRPANLTLAIVLCAVAFILSTPLISFGALSARDQLARLADGRTKADKFDWRALRWDFGAAGQAAVTQLAKTGATPAIREAALKMKNSTDRYDPLAMDPTAKSLSERLTILPKPVALPAALKTELEGWSGCTNPAFCTLLYSANADEAILVRGRYVNVFRRDGDAWRSGADEPMPSEQSSSGASAGAITVREVQRRQVFVGDKPVGTAFK